MSAESSNEAERTGSASGILLELSASRRVAESRYSPQADSRQVDDWCRVWKFTIVTSALQKINNIAEIFVIRWNPGKNEGPMARVRLVQSYYYTTMQDQKKMG